MSDAVVHTPSLSTTNVGGKIFAGRLGAELGSVLLATRLVPMVERIAPHRYDRLKERLAHWLEPNIAWYEAHLLSLPAFSSASEAEKVAKDPAAKAKVIASAIVDFSAMTAGAVVGQIATQGVLNHFIGLRPMKDSTSKGLRSAWQQARNLGTPVIFDKLVNMSLVGLLQYGVPQHTQSVTDDTSSLLQRSLGIPPDATQYFLQWGVPHLAGAATSTLLMSAKYRDLMNAAAHAAR